MDFAKVSQRLIARKAELLNRASRLSRHTRHRDEPLPQDFAEQAVELENQEVLEALDTEVQLELRSIERALQRIEAGTYHVCADCGEPILPARLEALPQTAFCVECANKH